MTGFGVAAVSVHTGAVIRTQLSVTTPLLELETWKSEQLGFVNCSVAADETAGITSASARPNAAMMNRGRMVTP